METRERYDVAVIGAGPGGAAAALTAARLGRRVLIVDPLLGVGADAPAKPCGEGMMPAGAAALSELGLEPARLGRPFPGVRYYAPDVKPLDVDFPSPGLAVHRKRLQAALVRAVRAEAHIDVLEAAASTRQAASGYVVTVGGREFAARTLIAADGLGGRSAQWLRRRPGRERPKTARAGRTGLRVHCAVTSRRLDRVEVHFGADCEVYLTPVSLDEPLVNVAILFDELPAGVRGGEALLGHALAAHPAAKRVLGERRGRVESRALRTPRAGRLSDGGSFLVGDAGGGVDPILGCGVTVALRSGIAAAHGAHRRCSGVPSRRIARAYVRAYRGETAARRRVAAFLIAASARPRLARATVVAARALPALTRRLVSFAARVEPLPGVPPSPGVTVRA